MRRSNGYYMNESADMRYVDAEEGLDLMERGYEIHGRGTLYGSYRFSKRPGSDRVTFWYRDDNENWDNGWWTTDEFLDNMTSAGDVKMLYVPKRQRVMRESENPARNSRAKKTVNESINYGSLSYWDRMRMDRLVKNLKSAKEAAEGLLKYGEVRDDETIAELYGVRDAIGEMMDRLSEQADT